MIGETRSKLNINVGVSDDENHLHNGECCTIIVDAINPSNTEIELAILATRTAIMRTLQQRREQVVLYGELK